MSDDIVDRLRSFRPPYGWPEEKAITPTPTLNNVAADEITRLRADLAAANARAKKAEFGDHSQNEHVPTWRELTEYWKQRAEAAEADLAAARELLKEARWSVQHCRLLKLLARIDAALKGDDRE